MNCLRKYFIIVTIFYFIESKSNFFDSIKYFFKRNCVCKKNKDILWWSKRHMLYEKLEREKINIPDQLNKEDICAIQFLHNSWEYKNDD